MISEMAISGTILLGISKSFIKISYKKYLYTK
jgi:hypothetical protein